MSIAELTAEEEASLVEGRCPDCGSTGWYRGPSGGLSTNYKCAGEGCGSRFNVAIITVFGDPVIFGERLSKERSDGV